MYLVGEDSMAVRGGGLDGDILLEAYARQLTHDDTDLV
jgi:hypothetical protein